MSSTSSHDWRTFGAKPKKYWKWAKSYAANQFTSNYEMFQAVVYPLERGYYELSVVTYYNNTMAISWP